MSAYKSYFLVLFLFVSGCATQQMSGSSQSKQSPSSSGGMPSSSSSSPSSSSSGGMPSSSSSSPSSSSSGGMPSSSSSSPSSSSSGGMPSSSSSSPSSSSSGGMPSSSSSSPSSSSSGGMPSSSSSSPSSSSSGGMPSSSSSSSQVGQSASSIFNESLGDFDKEMAGERDIIAASNQGNSSMTSQEIADMESIMGADLDGPIDISGDLGNNESQVNEDSEGELTDEMSEEEISRLPSCVDKNGSGEDKIARQLRVFAIKEDDPNIRNEIWKQYLKHMGIGQSAIDECLSK